MPDATASGAELSFGAGYQEAEHETTRAIRHRALGGRVPALAVVAILLIALLLAGYVISEATGFVSGGVFAYPATIPRWRRRPATGLLVLTSVLEMVAGFVILFPRIPPPSFYDAGASLGWIAFGPLDVVLL